MSGAAHFTQIFASLGNQSIWISIQLTGIYIMETPVSNGFNLQFL